MKNYIIQNNIKNILKNKQKLLKQHKYENNPDLDLHNSYLSGEVEGLKQALKIVEKLS